MGYFQNMVKSGNRSAVNENPSRFASIIETQYQDRLSARRPIVSFDGDKSKPFIIACEDEIGLMRMLESGLKTADCNFIICPDSTVLIDVLNEYMPFFNDLPDVRAILDNSTGPEGEVVKGNHLASILTQLEMCNRIVLYTGETERNEGIPTFRDGSDPNAELTAGTILLRKPFDSQDLLTALQLEKKPRQQLQPFVATAAANPLASPFFEGSTFHRR